MIIRNSSVFSFDYVPADILHREKEIKTIQHAINSFFRGVKNHVFVYGTQGTGKTAVSKFLSSKLVEEGKLSIYVDAKTHSSKVSLLNEILRSLGLAFQARGISFEEFLSRVKGREKHIVVFLDEVDSFKDKELLYSLSKSDFPVMFVFISNIPSLSRVLSKMAGLVMTQEFLQYTPAQLRDILKERAKMGLLPSSYNDDLLSKIAGFSAKHKGNARAGIMLLFHSALIAEEDGRDYISLKDVDEAKNILLNSLLNYDLSSFSDEKRKILELLLNSQYKTLEEISSAIPSKGERMIRNYLKELVEQGYVSEEEIKVGKTSKKIYRIKLKV